MSGATQTGRTINGHTYTDAPVDVKLGPNTFRIPANYLDSQIAPARRGRNAGHRVAGHEADGAGCAANPRTNDFRKEIPIRINYVDRVPVETLLSRLSSNEAITEEALWKGRIPGTVSINALRSRKPWA